ncbi:MAG: hypothetical protein JXA92_09365 [candidate division Zixibacteria bacterium]|nr:hypothetical protein [candidate division Zixibacteria bacterium]
MPNAYYPVKNASFTKLRLSSIIDYGYTLEPSLTPEESCCNGQTGNADCSLLKTPDISDITRLIDFLYLTHTPLPDCP